jgi:hypothetical protein
MAIYKNASGQKVAVFAYDKTTGAAKTGDAANITAYLSKDFAAAAAVADTNPTELDATNMAGWYVFDLTQAETDAEVLVIAPKSATADIVLEQVQVTTLDAAISSRLASGSYTAPDNATIGTLANRLTADRAGYLDKLNVSGTLAHSEAADTYKADVSGLSTLTEEQVKAQVDAALADYDGPTHAELTAATSPLATAAAIAALNNLSAAQAQTAATAALNAYDPPTKGELDSAVSGLSTFDPGTDDVHLATGELAGLSTLTAGQVNAEVDAALADYDGPTKAEMDAAKDAVLLVISQLNDLDSAGAQAAAAAALAAYDAATGADVSAAVSGLSTFNPATDDVHLATGELAGLSTLTAGQVNAEVDAALADYDGPTHAELTAATSPLATAAAIAALNNLSAAQAQTAATAALNAYDPPTHAELTAALVGIIDQQAIEDTITGALSGAEVTVDVDAIALAVYAYVSTALIAAAVIGPGAQLDGGDITVHRGDTLRLPLTGLRDLTPRTKLWWTVKAGTDRLDAAAEAQLVEGVGLTIAARMKPFTAELGALTVTDAAAGNLTITLDEAVTAKMPTGDLVWDIQMLTNAGDIDTLASGTIRFTADVTRAVV